MAIEDFYVHALTTTRATKTRTASGGFATVQTVVLAAEPCAIRPVSAVEKEKAAAELAEATDWVYLRGDADLRRDDLVTVAGTTVAECLVRFVENPHYLDRFLRAAVKVERKGT